MFLTICTYSVVQSVQISYTIACSSNSLADEERDYASSGQDGRSADPPQATSTTTVSLNYAQPSTEPPIIVLQEQPVITHMDLAPIPTPPPLNHRQRRNMRRNASFREPSILSPELLGNLVMGNVPLPGDNQPDENYFPQK
jgi:hypothetical protein